ncbi:MAG: class I tRNA ligase family protein [Candidatus Nomurabacteria bacterium]|jgi:isoleucyl-tRNA synthetase|nr:class I tRNA ligase family protein [Candidatus Nomurabacteria bacterium]
MKFKYGTRRKAIEYEKAIAKWWKENQIFEKSVEQRAGGDAYVFYDGPPFITGLPHHGTLLSSVVKDVIPRYQTMNGKRVERVWGWDCHGLPAENFTEKHLNGTVSRKAGGKPDELLLKSGDEIKEITLEEYVTTARDMMVANSETWEQYIDRIGRWVDFKGAYRTMDKDFMESVWWAFAELYKKGKIYEGEKVLMYDTKFATPVSKAEVTMDNDAYQTVTDPSVYVKFKIVDKNNNGEREFGLKKPDETEKDAIIAIVRNPKTKQVLVLNWGERHENWGGRIFIGGGMEKGENPIETARREIAEETGYKNVKLVKKASEKVHNHFYSNVKNKNMFVHFLPLLFELENDEQVERNLDENEDQFSIEWVDEDNLEKIIDDPAHYHGYRLLNTKESYLLAWTTTPWTLPANMALAVNPKLKYVEVEINDERLVLAKDLVEKVLGKDAKIVREMSGKELVGVQYVPLFLEVEASVVSRKIVNRRIIDIVKKLGLPLDEVLVFGSGIMDVLGMKESDDIDLIVSDKVFEAIENSGQWSSVYKKAIDKIMRKKIVDGMEVETSGGYDWLDWYDEKSGFKGLIQRAEKIDGVNFVNLPDLLDWKKSMNREKDQKDIKLIEEYLARNSSAHQIYSADFVENEGGTGIVHIAPAYGEADFDLAKQYNIPVKHVIDDNGYYTPATADQLHKIGVRDTDERGIEVWAANKFIAKCLEEQGVVWKIYYIQHEYPFNPRSKQRIMYRAIPSWFMDIQGQKPLMLAQNQPINWFPPHIKNGRFAKNIDQAPDWTLSRNRFWATALPVWKGDKGTVKVVGSYAELEELSGQKLDDYHRPWVDKIEFDLVNGTPVKNTEIYFVRHGLADYNKEGRIQGDSEVGLNDEGRKQAKALGGELKKMGTKFDAIFVSPMKHTIETAEIINKSFKSPLIIRNELIKRDYGDQKGKIITQKNYEDSWDYEKSLSGPGENIKDLFERVHSFIDWLKDNYTGKKVVIVAHSSVSRAFKFYFEKMPKDGKLAKYYMPNDEILRFNVKSDSQKGEVEHFTRIEEVLDGWFESGSMPFAQFHYPFENKEKFEQNYPADFIVEYVAQVRAWFYYVHAIGTALFGENAFSNVIVTGTIAGEDGRKMSKSLGNYTDPMELMDKFSADSLRFLLASSPLLSGEDFSLKDKDVGDVARKLAMIWNMYDFFTMYAEVDGWEYKDKTLPSLSPADVKSPLDKWIISRIHKLRNHITEYMDAYNLPDAMSAILPFVDDASNWYVRRSRRRFWKSDDDADKNEAYRTLHYVLVYLSQLLAPFVPFLAEELYQKLTGGESVHLLDWPEAGEIDQKVVSEMAATREIIEKGLALRMDREDEFGQIKVRQPLNKLEYTGTKLSAFYEQIIAEEVNVKKVVQGKTMKLDKVLTKELRVEGFVRELIRFVQNARKKAGLSVDDRIVLSILGYDFEKLPKKMLMLIKTETLATKITNSNYDYDEIAKVDGVEVTISLQKA